MAVAMMIVRLLCFRSVCNLDARGRTFRVRVLRVMIHLLVRRVIMEPSVRDRRRRRGESAEQGDDKRDQAEAERPRHTFTLLTVDATRQWQRASTVELIPQIWRLRQLLRHRGSGLARRPSASEPVVQRRSRRTPPRRIEGQ